MSPRPLEGKYMLQAKCIHYDMPTRRLVAVYEPSTDLVQLGLLAREITERTDAAAYVKTKRIKQNGLLVPVPGIEISSSGDTHHETTCHTLKELTQPKLPYTGVFGAWRLMACACGQLDMRVGVSFVLGLAPDDSDDFVKKVHQEMLQVPLEDALRALRGRRVFTVLNRLDEAFRKHGADIAELTLESEPAGACIHQS